MPVSLISKLRGGKLGCSTATKEGYDQDCFEDAGESQLTARAEGKKSRA